MFKRLNQVLLSLFVFLLVSVPAFAALSIEAEAAKTSVLGMVTDYAAMGWAIMLAVFTAMAGIGLFIKFAKKGGAK